MKRITITIAEDGTPTIETSGFIGASCVEATRKIVEAFGGKVEDEKRTAEYYQREQVQRGAK